MRSATHDLLHDFTGRVEVDETLVHFELVTIPSFGTFTTRLEKV
jgi:hypothetical protein